MSVVTNVLGVWQEVMVWFGNAFEALQPIFYDAESGLTFIGTLSVAGTAIAGGLLFLSLIQSFLRFGR